MEVIECSTPLYTNCVRELFFLHNVVNTTDRILNTLNRATALTSCSFVSEHFVNDNDNGNFHYNLTNAIYRRTTLGLNVQNQRNMLQTITTLRTSTR